MRMLIAILMAIIQFIHAIHLIIYRFMDQTNVNNNYVSTAHILALWLTFFGYLLLIIYLHLQRKYGFVNGGVVWFYLLLTTLFNILTIPFALEYRPLEHWIYLPVKLTTQIMLFIFCSFGDRNPLEVEMESSSTTMKIKHCPRDSSSIPSRLVFWWFNSLVTLGWRRSLQRNDLWLSRKHDSCSYLMNLFFKYTSIQSTTTTKSNPQQQIVHSNGDQDDDDNQDQDDEQIKHRPLNCNLWTILMKMYWKYLLFPAAGRLITDLLQLANPIILKLLIEYTTSNDTRLWHGILYSFGFFLINMIQSWSALYQFHRFSILSLRIRSTLIGAIYRKSLVLATDSRKDYNTGDIVNLMAIDSQRFIDLVRYANYIWTSPIMITIGFYLLYEEMGWSASGGFLLMFLLIPFQGYITRKIKSIQVKQMAEKDHRLQAINELLNGIKVLKLYAWEQAFIQNIIRIRSIELKRIRMAGLLTTIFVIVAITSPFLITFLVFAVYTKLTGMILTSKKAFVTIALFNLLRVPLSALPNVMTSLILTIVSMKRINRFLNAPELEDYVRRRPMKTDAIRLTNASFSWEQQQQIPTLVNINVRIPKGKLWAIVGQVGSGKSSFLNAILGEMHKQNGTVIIGKDLRIAYISQQAWIQNLTVRDNILFGKEFDQERYDRCINACALKTDLEMLDQGDQTEIGEKGINLSGGQKQRISIARACYSDADIYLFDDPLSAVDSHVGKHIFESVISSNQGILREKTRILVTNALYVLPLVDEVILLKNGNIIAVGSCQKLFKENETFKELMENYHPNHDQHQNIPNGNSINRQHSKISDHIEHHHHHHHHHHQRPRFHRQMTSDSLLSDTASLSSISTLESLEEEQEKIPIGKLIESESIETGLISWSVYKKFFHSITIKWIILIITGYSLFIISNSGANFWLSFWTDYIDHHQHDRGYELWIFLGIGILQLLFIAIGWSSIVMGCLHSSRILHQRLLSAIVHAPMYFFDTTPLGRIINRFSRDMDLLDNNMSLYIRIYLFHTMNVLATLFIITFQTPIFLVFVIPFIVVYALIQRFYICTSRQLKRIESVSRSPIFTHFSETLMGVSTIKAFNADERFIAESNERVDQNFQCFYPCQVADCWLLIRLEFLANLLIFSAAFIATMMKLINTDGNGLSGSQIGLSLSYALNITMSLNQVVRSSAEFENNVVSVERIDEYINVQPEADWYTDEDKCLQENWPSNGSIHMDDYATRYRPGLDLVLKGIDLNIKPGEKIGIVGRTGAGKSSLTLGLFRLIEAAQGRIIIDNIDIAKLGLHKLRSRLTIIPQDPVLFMGTIRFNLDPFEQYSDEQLWKCLELSHLKSFVSTLDLGLDHYVNEGGDNFSVGQRQLFCLTRALLRRTNVLILDEATAAVDFETDSLIQTTIRKEFSHCTILTIAHRLHTIMDSNRVLVLDAGNVAEFDQPKTLLSNRSSIFSSLAKDAGITHYSFDQNMITSIIKKQK
uniref:ABC-type glutathione-S-conjugate transporter n=1 Tax=Dermatophagoides pteronyssinus TaxID=6956 RepID=A0A6P6XN08_DERPT|nr:multidrug resistance-associated protein 1-like [Dermatophagoides pteronyssinus]